MQANSQTSRGIPTKVLAPRPCLDVSRCLPVAWLLATWFVFLPLHYALAAETASFALGGTTLSLRDDSSQVAVRYQSMRLNRALNVWNAEVVVENTGGRALRGPFVLQVDDFSGTSGPLLTDGIAAGKYFFDLSGAMNDGVLAPAEKSLPRTITLGRSTGVPQLATKFFSLPDRPPKALALARSLDEIGLPLPNVTVEESGPLGLRTNLADPVFGVVTLGQSEGSHTWKFSGTGYLPVWRLQTLSTGAVVVLPSPRLSRRSTNSVSVTPLGGVQVADPSGSIQASFAAGDVGQSVAATLTPLAGQTLPAFLPQGWSPLQAFWLEMSAEPLAPLSARLRPIEPIDSGETSALVRWNEGTVLWETIQIVSGDGTNSIVVSLPRSGAYALVVPDRPPLSPPAAIVGQALFPSTASLPDAATLAAKGTVNPASSPASRVPELVTGTATVIVSNLVGNIPSGLILRGEIQERHRLRDGGRRSPPQYEQFVVGYQRPGDESLSTVQASVPMRPLLLFGGEELIESTVTMDLLAPTPFSGTVLDPQGGIVANNGVSVLAGIGDLVADQASELRALSPTNFADVVGTNGAALAAFELSIAGVAPGRALAARFPPVPTNGFYVLARVLYDRGLYGLQPLERLSADILGRLASAETNSGQRLPGLTSAGQFLLVRFARPQALVHGTVINLNGQPVAGTSVRIPGQPWLTFSDTNGAYQLLAPTGSVAVTATDLQTGDGAMSSVTVTNAQLPVLANLSTAPTHPRVVSVSPNNNATRVPRVTPVVVTFSEAVNPAMLLNGGLQLLGSNNSPVAASVTLNLRNTTATLLPTAQLAPNAQHTIALSNNITDLTGQTLEGAASFTFTTESDLLNRVAGQVTSHEPDTNGMAVMIGSPGTAEAGGTVILVNETTGETAATLARDDGSFTDQIRAQVDDFLSSVIQNANGTRNTIPVSRQIFRDGSVGLFNGGGILEAQSDGGPVQVIVAPGSVPAKSKFKLELLTLTNLLAALGTNSIPSTNVATILGGFRYSRIGDELLQRAEVSFPVGETNLGFNSTNARYALTVARNVEGGVAYEIIDSMELEGSRLVTHSPPFTGLLGEFENALLAPMRLPGRQVAVAGRVIAVQINDNGQTVADSERAVPGAFVTITTDLAAAGAPGRLTGGSLFAISGTTGNYALLAPAIEGAAVVARAAHPRFPDLGALRTVTFPSVADGFANLSVLAPVEIVFRSRAPFSGDFTPPSVALSHAPVQPETNATLRVIAHDDVSIPTISVTVESVSPLVQGTAVGRDDVQITLTNTNSSGGDTKTAVYSITAGKVLRAVLGISAVDAAGNANQQSYSLRFGSAPPISTNDIAPSDLNDRTGPMVIASTPSRGTRSFPVGQPIVLTFDEPISRAVLQDPDAIRISLASAPALSLSDDQTQLTLTFSDLRPGTSYTLTLTSAIKDLSGNPLDQDPTLEGDNQFSLTFVTAPLTSAALPGMQTGGGVVTKGIYAYALERNGPLNGAVNVFDLSDPGRPTKVAGLGVPGFPRDLVLIPNYAFKRRPDGPAETNDLLAVVGGIIGGDVGQYLWVIDISNPLAPNRLASARLNPDTSVAVTKVAWSPPRLSYLEIGGHSTIGIINLQSFIIGELLRQSVNNFPFVWPFSGTDGFDANCDGDYVDVGDELPLPSRAQGQLAGRELAFVLDDTDQNILDFTVGRGGGFVGAVADAGHIHGTSETVSAAYRTLYKTNGFQCGPFSPFTINLDRTNASYVFTNGRPNRVASLLGTSLVVSNGLLDPVDLALVSVIGQNGGSNRLAVLDVTDPLKPTLLAEVVIPTDAGDAIYDIKVREDGLIALATGRDVYLLDPRKFGALTNGFSVHPAIVGTIPGAGSGARSFASSATGLNVVDLGGKNQLLQAAPTMRFVSFPSIALIHPRQLVGTNDTELSRRFVGARIADALTLGRFQAESGYTRSTLKDLDPTNHFYVFLRAPGGAGPTINLALESLNRAGVSLKKRGFLFPPVHALSAESLNGLDQIPLNEDAPVRSCVAWRLSGNPASEFYNVYLSRPFALVAESMTQDDLDELDDVLERDILWSGSYLRASIDSSEANNRVVGAFAGRIENNHYFPGVAVVAPSLPADYVMSPNPMPIRGGSMIALTGNTIAAHNSELMVNTVDMALPGRRLPLVFRRNYSGQALYDGPFGRGWDFNFNQRLIEFSPELFLAGITNPLVVRATVADSETATNRDLLFYNGAGRVMVYRHAGTNPPPGIADDPLAQQLNWVSSGQPATATTNIAAYYLPPPGLFSPLFKFKDGRFAQLDPDGTQTWFNHAGRLLKIYDRFETNNLELLYNDQGELVRIINDGGPPGLHAFYLDVGYFRTRGETLRPSLDLSASRPFLAGKIACLKDYTGRTVLFTYNDDGTLISRQTPEVSTVADAEGVKGRQITRYFYTGSSNTILTGKSLIRVRSPNRTTDFGGVESLQVSRFGSKGRDTVDVLQLAAREIRLFQSHENTASNLSASVGSIRVEGPSTASPKTVVSYDFDPFGRPEKIKVSNDSGAELVTRMRYRQDGLVDSMTYPEGNSVAYAYDFSAQNLRSRANLLKTEEAPDARGGSVLTTRNSYSPFYNLLDGNQTDAKIQPTTVSLSADHRSVMSISKGGERESFRFNEFGQLESHTDARNIVTSRTYTTNGFVASRTVGNLTTRWEYEGSAGLRGLPTRTTDPTQIPTTTDYDELDRLTGQARAGAQQKFCYDGSGNLCKRMTTVEANRNLVHRFAHNDFGFLESETVDDVAVGQAVQSLTTRYEPDDYYRVKRVIPPGGEKHEFDFDYAGRMICYRVPGAYEEFFGYDGNGNLTSNRVGNAANVFTYDGHDRVTETLSATGARIVRAYDGNHNLTDSSVFDTTDGNSVLAAGRSGYDELDRPTTLSRDTDSGTLTNSIRYQSAQRQTVFTSAVNEESTFTLNNDGRLQNVLNPRGTLALDYQDAARTITRTVTDQIGPNPQTYRFNELGHLDQFTDARQRQFNFARGFDGRVLSATTPENGTYHNDFTVLGEPSLMSRPQGQSLAVQYDARRDITSLAPVPIPGKGMSYGHDEFGRMTNSLDAVDKGSTYTDFNAFQQPTNGTLARGFAVADSCDIVGRHIARRISKDNTLLRLDTRGYDALSRVKGATNPFASVAFAYDKQGYAKTIMFGQFGTNWILSQKADAAGARTNVTYPDGLSIALTRDSSSRLQTIQPAGSDFIVKTSTYTAGTQVGERILGNNVIKAEFLYDADRRPSVRRFKRLSDDRVLAEVRYAYDGSGMQVARQFIHRAARTDLIGYDESHKVTRADLGARPKVPGELPRTVDGFTVSEDVPNRGNWAPGLFARDFGYTPTEVLTNAVLQNPDTLPAPPFAATFAEIDDTLHVGRIDGVARGRDEAGNVTNNRVWVRIPDNPEPQPVLATNIYNELDQLTLIVRADGVTVSNVFGPTGLRIQRRVTGPANRCVPSNYEYLYNGIRIIEIRDLDQPDHRLIARFHYGDNGDELIAGDLLDINTLTLRRYYYLTDTLGSVMALADGDGNVVERYSYDVWGEPIIQPPDNDPPQVSLVTREGNQLVIQFTEAVLPMPAGDNGSGLIQSLGNPSAAIRVESGGMPVAGTIQYEERSDGRFFGTTYQFTSSGVLPAGLQLVVNAGTLQDGAGNPNPGERLTLLDGAESYRGPQASSAAQTQLARSEFFSPFAFHGQIYDEDSGLVYLRARFYDPANGSFIQRDPSGYKDSVNQYASFANNSINFRDPLGLEALQKAGDLFHDSALDSDMELAFAGAVYGASKVVVSGFVGIGKFAYYTTSAQIYEASALVGWKTGTEIWRDQRETYVRGVQNAETSITHAFEQGVVGTVSDAVEAHVTSLQRQFWGSIEADDPFGAGEAWGQFGMETALVADAARSAPRMALSYEPAAATAQGITIGGGISVVVTGPKNLTSAILLSAHSGDEATSDEVQRRGRISNNANPGRRTATKELPALDSKGKVHGDLPRREDLSRYSPDELEQLASELRQSVKERIRKTTQLGRDRGHAERQAAEQRLIKDIETYFSE